MISFKFVNGDFSLDGDGGLAKVSGTEGLKQWISKLLMTDKENIFNEGHIPFRYNPDYGTNINYVKQLSPIFTSTDAREAVQEEVRSTLLQFSKNQTAKLGYGLNADEIMSDATITVTVEPQQDSQVKRIIVKFSIEVVAASGKTTNLEIETSAIG